MAYERVYRHGAVARLTHFLHLVGMLLLILSGFQILYPSSFRVFGALGTARKVHFWAMYLMFIPYMFRWFWHAILERDWGSIIYRPVTETKRLPGFIKYYLFMSKEKPWGHEYNPGQRVTYSMWPFLVLLQGLTGFALYWPDKLPGVVGFFGGILALKFWHTIIAWVFVVTLAIHMYLGSTGYTLADAYMSMVTGWEKQKKHA